MYKDKTKQKEANRRAKMRQRQQKGMTKGMTFEGVTLTPAQNDVIPKASGFDSLPIDVRMSIASMSRSPEEKAQRTAIALDYQYKHGKRPGTGMDCHIPASTAKPGDDDYHTHTGPDEGCSQCHSTLPRLEQPRQYPGMCMVCVVKGAA